MKSYFVILLLVIIGTSDSIFSQTVTIGTQVWMTKNLDVSTFRNGDPIPEAKTAEEWIKAGKNEQPAWCYYDNDPKNWLKYGKLYNWYAVIDTRGIAPMGWRVPSVKDYEILFKNLDPKTIFSPGNSMDSLDGVYKVFFSEEIGEVLKSKSDWENSVLFSNKPCGPLCNGNNISGLDIKPSSHRNNYAYFMQKTNCMLWTSNESNIWGGGYFIDIVNDSNKAELGLTGPINGLAIRCLKE